MSHLLSSLESVSPYYLLFDKIFISNGLVVWGDAVMERMKGKGTLTILCNSVIE